MRKREKKEAPQRSNAPEVVYTQPKPFQRRRFILHLLTVFAVVLAIFMGISVFFKVKTVMVSGAEQYSAESILEASGLEKGDSLLFFGEGMTAGRILKELPYIRQVHFDIKLPGTVTIIVEEIQVVYAIREAGGNWWLMSSDGKLTEQIDLAKANEYTKILGVEIRDPEVGEMAQAAETAPDPNASVPAAEKAADRLEAALLLAVQLEENEILGKVASVDVSDLVQLQLWYGKQYQVKLGTKDHMDHKIAAFRQTLLDPKTPAEGIMDLTAIEPGKYNGTITPFA